MSFRLASADLLLAALLVGACGGSLTPAAAEPAASPTTAPAAPAPSPPFFTGPLASVEAVIAAPREASAGQLAGAVIFHGARTQKIVALTFDDCYSVPNLRAIVAILRREHVPATFFPVAEAAVRNKSLWRSIAVDFAIGDHTLSHATLTTLASAGLLRQISAGRSVLESVIGRPISPLIRPPGGAYDQRVVRAARALGLAVVLWDVDTRDWADPSAAVVESRAVRGLPGSIVLMHASHANMPAALAQIIARYRARGFTFATIPSLIGLDRGTSPASGSSSPVATNTATPAPMTLRRS